jgi:hypothetical protein
VLPSTVRVPPPIANVLSPAIRVSLSIVRVTSPIVGMPVILLHRGEKRLLLQDVLIMEAINLDVWIFMPSPRRAPAMMVYDNDLEWGGHEIE